VSPDLIVSKNLARRQLNTGQRALMALEYERYYAAAQAKGRPKDNGSDAARSRKVKETPADLPEPVAIGPSPGAKHHLVGLERDRRARESSERAATVVGASGRAVRQAKAVARDAPDLAAKVRAGEFRHPCTPRIGDSPPVSPVRGPPQVTGKGPDWCGPLPDSGSGQRQGWAVAPTLSPFRPPGVGTGAYPCPEPH